MSTVAELVDQTLNEILLGTYRTKTNVVDEVIDRLGTDLKLRHDPLGVGVGSFLEINNELMYVTAVGQANRTVSVIRGQRGTNPEGYNPGTPVNINPRFPRFVVKDTLKEEIHSWPQDIYMASAHTAGVTGNDGGIDLLNDLVPKIYLADDQMIYDVIRLWRSDGSSHRNIRIYGFRTEIDMDGIGSCRLYVDQRYSTGIGFTMLVARSFDTTRFEFDTDLVDEVGLRRSFEEVLKWGAAWRLVAGRETRRLFTEAEGEGRKAEEVPVQANVQAARIYKGFRDMALTTEIMKLRQRAGVRIRG